MLTRSNTIGQGASRARQQGLSLVELMVGIAVGMFVVAAAVLMVSTQLSDNRRLLAETQVQQDLRAAMDIITRDLRRSGARLLVNAHVGMAGVTAEPLRNEYAPLTLGSGTSIEFKYVRNAAQLGPFGFKLNGGAIETRLTDGGWQQLTDRSAMEVTAFTVDVEDEPPIRLTCPRACTPPSGSTDTEACWPQLLVRRITIDITGRPVAYPAATRSLRSTVRLRNDEVVFNGPSSSAPICP